MSGLVRRPGWEARLAAFLEARRSLPFEWGGNDCCSFAIAWVEQMTGRRVFEIDWTDAASAAGKLRRLGGMRQAWTDTLGTPLQNWRYISRGDVSIAQDDKGHEVGMVCTGRTLAGAGLEHMMQLPIDRALLVWRIG